MPKLAVVGPKPSYMVRPLTSMKRRRAPLLRVEADVSPVEQPTQCAKLRRG